MTSHERITAMAETGKQMVDAMPDVINGRVVKPPKICANGDCVNHAGRGKYCRECRIIIRNEQHRINENLRYHRRECRTIPEKKYTKSEITVDKLVEML